MAPEFVTVSECQRTREGMYKDLSRVDQTVAVQGVDIADTKVILAKLTLLQEIALKNQDDLSQAVKDIDKRVEESEIARLKHEAELSEKAELEASKSKKFWESSTGEWVIKGFFFIFALIVLVALDQNIGILDKVLGK